jgi:prevent-host-death family protein
MKQLGAYEARTHLARVLDEVERGESFAITKHGRIVAHLVPPIRSGELTAAEAVDGLRRFRRGRRLKGVTFRELIADGRRR